MREEVDSALNDLRMSEKTKPLYEAVIKHIRDNVDPITEEYFRLGEGREDIWSYAPGQLELLDGAKQKAKDAGLWNFFLPESQGGAGVSNLEYAHLAEVMARNGLYRDAPPLPFVPGYDSVGIVEKDRIIDPKNIEVGDAVITLREKGFRCNGFSL